MKDFLLRLAILFFIFVLIPLILIYIMFDSVSTDYIKVYNHKTGKITKMKFDDYLTGVVAAEMPAEFHVEALKAQSVAARTYALGKLSEQNEFHKDADICTDPSHCQAFLSEEELKKKWGSDYKKLYKKLDSSVKACKNKCIMYDGEFATSVFHSCSNGKTENAQDVWGGNINYLRCVESPGDELKKDYISQQSFSLENFNQLLGDNEIKKIVPDLAKPVIGDITLTEGENVKSIMIYGESFTGVEIRKIFSLKSAAFDVRLVDGFVSFTVYGNGHGVGMSQYGANYMAENGSMYEDILAHYYPGTNITDMYN